MESCANLHEDLVRSYEDAGLAFCPPAWDNTLCWPPTPAGQVANLSCPPLLRMRQDATVERVCLDSGEWMGPPAGALVAPPAGSGGIAGWTNYTPCVVPETMNLLNKLGNYSEHEIKMIIYIAQTTRTLEWAGLIVSLLSLIVSLVIFSYFRSLQNHRTRIHKNLFAAIGIQVIVRLTLYMDQALIVQDANDFDDQSLNATQETDPLRSALAGIHGTASLCEWFYIVLEYARTTMFVWMFIEGLFLHNLITVMVFRPDTYHKLYLALGWGVPVVLTAVWASYMATQHSMSRCWTDYNLMPTYWLLEGPRMTIILINLLYLLNILRVLVTKLRNSQCSEAEQLRKAVKAAIVLLPLLGITNILVMVGEPLDSIVKFALWSYSSHFLTSFQGFFVALLYCFLNGEVRSTLGKKVRNYMTDRQIGTSLLGWGHGSTRLVSQFANPSTQVELDRDGHGLDGHPLQHKPPSSPSPSSSPSSGSEKHPKHLLRTVQQQQQHSATDGEPTNLLVVTTLV